MLLVAVVVLLVGSTAAWLAVSLPQVRQEQIHRGLFGDVAREGLIRKWFAGVLADAEREVRLAHFDASLRSRMWEGTIAQLGHPHVGGSSILRFANGEVWQLDLARLTPRSARRIVVRSVEHRGPNLRLGVYVPGRRELALDVVDARIAVN